MYPFLGALLSWTTSAPLDLALQVISMLALTGFLWNMRQLLQESWPGRNHNVFWLALVALSPYLLRAAIIVLPDALGLFFVSGALLHFSRSVRYSTVTSFAWFGLFSALAITTQFQTLVLLLPLGISTIGNALRRWQYLHIAIAFGLFFMMWIPEWSIKGTDLQHSFGSDFFRSWRPLHWFQSSFNSPFGPPDDYLLPNILFGFNSLVHPGYCVLGAGLLAFFRKEDWHRPLLQISLIAYGLYALFISGIPFQNNRFFLASFPFLLLALNPAWYRLQDWLERWGGLKKAFPIVLVAVQLSLCCIPVYRAWDYNLKNPHGLDVTEGLDRYTQLQPKERTKP